MLQNFFKWLEYSIFPRWIRYPRRMANAKMKENRIYTMDYNGVAIYHIQKGEPYGKPQRSTHSTDIILFQNVETITDVTYLITDTDSGAHEFSLLYLSLVTENEKAVVWNVCMTVYDKGMYFLPRNLTTIRVNE